MHGNHAPDVMVNRRNGLFIKDIVPKSKNFRETKYRLNSVDLAGSGIYRKF